MISKRIQRLLERSRQRPRRREFAAPCLRVELLEERTVLSASLVDTEFTLADGPTFTQTSEASPFDHISSNTIVTSTFGGSLGNPLDSEPRIQDKLAGSLATGDFDGDSNLDIAVANSSNNSIDIYLNQGWGIYKSVHSVAEYPLLSEPETKTKLRSNGAVLQDLGDPLGLEPSRTLSLVHYVDYSAIGAIPKTGLDSGREQTVDTVLSEDVGETDSQLQANADAGGQYPISVASGDLNGDSTIDLIASNFQSHTVSVFLNEGSAVFAPQAVYRAGRYPLSVTLGDVDGDDTTDIVVGNFTDKTISVLLNAGDGSFGSAISYAVGGTPSSLDLADLDRNGYLDVAVANYDAGSVTVLFSDARGRFVSRAEVAVGPEPIALSADDFNGDGRPDLAVLTESSMAIIQADDTQSLEVTHAFNVEQRANVLVTGDVDQDGDIDVGVADTFKGELNVFHNNGQGSFVASATSYRFRSGA